MKHIFYTLAILTSVASFGQVTGISIETVVVHTGPTTDGVDLTGYTTYRVYATCITESTAIKSVWGNNESPLVITTTGHFYNQLNGSYSATGANQAMLDAIPSLHFDSWITLDLEISPVPLTQIYYLSGNLNWWNSINESFDVPSGISYVANSVIGEIWSSNTAASAGSDLKILVAQLTTDGDLGVQMNFQYSLDDNCGTGSENITLSAGNPQIGCSDTEACNYDSLYDPSNAQVCTYPGCTDVFACNFDPQASCDDGSCSSIYGCMNPLACNYDPLATCYDNCIMPTCHDPLACNYNLDGCEGGICDYNRRISFYRDLNMNGTKNPNEPNLSNLGITLNVDGNSIYTNTNGHQFQTPADPNPIDVSIVDYNPDFALTSSPAFQLDLCEIENVGFNLISSTGLNIQPYIGAIFCTSNHLGQIFISNQNSTPVNITVTLAHSSELAFLSADNSGSSSTGLITWNLNNVASYNDFTLHYVLLPPDISFLGDEFNYVLTVNEFDLLGNLLNVYTYNFVRTYFCGYDPNNKVSELVGYRDEHFILESDVIPYTINFQNTGNAPATQVTVADTLDTSVYDLSTLEITGSSHEMYAIIEENGSVQFVFENINLPDSSSDEIGSRGYIMYNIEPLDGLLPFTELVNDADIYFDSNPPIQTNSTTHTIFHCSLMEEELVDMTLCDGAVLTMDAMHEYVEEYAWVIDGQLFTTAPELTYQGAVGVHTIELQTANPLCEQSFPFELNMAALPEVSIVVYWNENSVHATGGIYYDWYTTESGLIPDQHGEIIAFESIYIYGLEVYAIGTDSNGCQNTSNTELLWSIDELEISKIDIWPNPFEEKIYFNLPSGKWQMSCFDTKGKLIFSEKNLIGNNMINLEKFSSGLYTIIFKDEKGQLLKGKVIRE